jgi:hypothetical protein
MVKKRASSTRLPYQANQLFDIEGVLLCPLNLLFRLSIRTHQTNSPTSFFLSVHSPSDILFVLCFLVFGGNLCGCDSLMGLWSASSYDRRNGALMELFWRWVCRNTRRRTCLSVPLSTINPIPTSVARSRQPTAWAMTQVTKSLFSRTAVCMEF